PTIHESGRFVYGRGVPLRSPCWSLALNLTLWELLTLPSLYDQNPPFAHQGYTMTMQTAQTRLSSLYVLPWKSLEAT
ncbi:MAG TPA: hypothetical protein VJ761_04380, partial [Ktedonobacteraceae bacterium]|nr:hypothetical protein [Ktedonobacteraceae bacterium]